MADVEEFQFADKRKWQLSLLFLFSDTAAQRCSPKRCSYRFRKIQRKDPVSESPFY